MRKWKLVRSDENHMLNERIMTDGDIISEYWSEWYGRMCEKYGQKAYSIDECIKDFVLIHWAVEVNE